MLSLLTPEGSKTPWPVPLRRSSSCFGKEFRCPSRPLVHGDLLSVLDRCRVWCPGSLDGLELDDGVGISLEAAPAPSVAPVIETAFLLLPPFRFGTGSLTWAGSEPAASPDWSLSSAAASRLPHPRNLGGVHWPRFVSNILGMLDYCKMSDRWSSPPWTGTATVLGRYRGRGSSTGPASRPPCYTPAILASSCRPFAHLAAVDKAGSAPVQLGDHDPAPAWAGIRQRAQH